MSSSRLPYAILGALSILMSWALGLVSLVLMLETGIDLGEKVFLFFMLVVCVLLFVEGILMFVLPARIRRLVEKDDAARGAGADAGEAAQAQREADQPAAGADPQPAAAAQAQATSPQPAAAAQAQATSPQPAAASQPAAAAAASEKTKRIVTRSDDIFATAKDLVHAWHTNPDHAQHLIHLASMLHAAGIDSWENPPTCGVTVLSRTRSYWLRHDTDELDEQDYDRFVSAEAALNLDLALPELATLPYDDPVALDKTHTYLRGLCDQDVRAYDFSPSLGNAYPTLDAQNTPGEWLVRASVVNDAECVRLPFRLTYELQANAPEGLVALSVEVPRPRCFAVASPSKRQRVAHARAYALRLSWLLASHAFQNLPMITRVVVVCGNHGHEDALLAIDFNRGLVRRLHQVVTGTGIDESGFPEDRRILANFDAQGWFVPLSLPPEITSAFDVPPAWVTTPELDERVLSPHTREVTGATHVRNLSINENARRVHAADELERGWDALEERTCASVVSTLVAMRDATDDVSVAEACNRAITALLDGSVDPTNTKELRALIVSDGILQEAAMRAAQIMDAKEPDLEEAVRILREALDPIWSVGFYADDEDCVYRYFGSVPERLVFNTRVDDHTREVRLVPDSYCNVLSLLSTALSALEKNDEAAAVADEMLRIAPTSMDAVLRKVRTLENASRVFEAAELIRDSMQLVLTPRDAALALYRLAYMQWRLGREDLAAACYQRSLAWHTRVYDQAETELQDLLNSYPNLTRLSDDDACALLAREGIPLGFTQANKERVLTAATLLIDDHAFVVATPLLSVLCSVDGDDIMMGIRRSVAV